MREINMETWPRVEHFKMLAASISYILVCVQM